MRMGIYQGNSEATERLAVPGGADTAALARRCVLDDGEQWS